MLSCRIYGIITNPNKYGLILDNEVDQIVCLSCTWR